MGYKTNVASWRLCKEHCIKNVKNGCKYWSYLENKNCEVKTAILNRVASTGSVSGGIDCQGRCNILIGSNLLSNDVSLVMTKKITFEEFSDDFWYSVGCAYPQKSQ